MESLCRTPLAWPCPPTPPPPPASPANFRTTSHQPPRACGHRHLRPNPSSLQIPSQQRSCASEHPSNARPSCASRPSPCSHLAATCTWAPLPALHLSSFCPDSVTAPQLHRSDLHASSGLILHVQAILMLLILPSVIVGLIQVCHALVGAKILKPAADSTPPASTPSRQHKTKAKPRPRRAVGHPAHPRKGGKEQVWAKLLY